MGGSFDPPHLGHLEAATELLTHPGVKNVVFLPSARPRFKAPTASISDRVKMIDALAAENERLSVSMQEIEWAEKNPALPNTTFDTLSSLPKDGREYAFVIGLDQFRKLSEWHRFPDVLSLSHWIVLARKPSTIDDAFETAKSYLALGILKPLGVSTAAPEFDIIGKNSSDSKQQKRLIIVETQARDVSSTEIRAEIARSGKPPLGALLPEVEAHLIAKKLYGT